MMRLSPARFRLRYVGFIGVAVVFTGFVIGNLPTHRLAAPVELLPPTGPLAVGRTSYHWVDDSPRPLDLIPSADPEVMVHVWYPAVRSPTDETAPYIPELSFLQVVVGADELRDAAGASYEALSTARTHVVAEAPLNQDTDKFPVLLLTHGLRFNALGYSMLCEELASHGYIVVGIDHPETAFAVLFPEKRVTLFAESLWAKQRTQDEAREFERQRVESCAEDIQFVVDQLEQLESGAIPSPFAGRLDLARVGVFGHSFGGRVAARACQLDARLKAGIICDGLGRQMTVAKDVNGRTVEQPMMVQSARRVPLHGCARILALLQTPGCDLEAELRAARTEFCASVTAPSYEVTLNLPGIIHESFSDIPLLESGQTEETSRGRKRAMEITRSFTRAFLDRHLLGRSVSLLDDVPYSPAEVELARHTFNVR